MKALRKSYQELSKLKTFEERFLYLKTNGNIGQSTFGGSRYLNQDLYRSDRWRKFRNKVIIRDHGCDLGIDGHEIQKYGIIHHINPITPEDILNNNPCVFDLDNVILVSHQTHNAIHYGDDSVPDISFVERTPNDTCPWRK